MNKILMVRKPDFLGESRWEFRYEKRQFLAKIADLEWLRSFQSGAVDIRHGDALHVRVRETVTYDHDGEVVRGDHEILNVFDVERPPIQARMLAP